VSNKHRTQNYDQEKHVRVFFLSIFLTECSGDAIYACSGVLYVNVFIQISVIDLAQSLLYAMWSETCSEFAI